MAPDASRNQKAVPELMNCNAVTVGIFYPFQMSWHFALLESVCTLNQANNQILSGSYLKFHSCHLREKSVLNLLVHGKSIIDF
jgi:hypothetical protein